MVKYDTRILTGVHKALLGYRRDKPDATIDDIIRLTAQSLEALEGRPRPQAETAALRAAVGGRPAADQGPLHPDFAALYGTDDGDLPPRLAALLWIGAELLIDPAGLTQPSDWLPPAASQYGPEFTEHMRDVVADLRDRLASGRMRQPRNMAEQIALGAIINQAKITAELMRDAPEHQPWVADLPTTEYGGIENAEDILMEDTDHEMFYWASEYAEVALDPRGWFEPFNTALPASIFTPDDASGD